jgi:hypothetical protein
MEPSAREFIEALIQIPEVSVTGSQIQSQAVLIFVEVQVRVGQCAKWGAITRAIHQYIDRKVQPPNMQSLLPICQDRLIEPHHDLSENSVIDP